MSRTRSVIAALMAVLVVVGSGCTRSDSGASGGAAALEALPVDPAAQSVVDELRALPFDESKLHLMGGLLAEAGVGVYPDDAVDGSEPVRLTEWQVGNLAAEAANGGGVTGETLRELAPMPEGAPPISYLLAAWVMAYPSPSAGFARALLGEQEWEQADQIVFPKLLLTLFVADAVAAGPEGYQPEQRPVALRLASAVSATQANVCSAASSFIQQAIASVAEALKVDTSGGGLLGFLGSIWNFAVDLAAGVVRGLIKAFQDLAVGLLVDAFALVAVVQEVYSYVVEWRADLIAVPEENRFGVGDEVVTGELELQVVDNQLPVPALVLDCAKVFGVDMTRLGSAEGATVDWDFYLPTVARSDLATPTSSDPVLSEHRNAFFRYQTGQESPELAAGGEENRRADLFRLKATARRDDLEKIRQLLTSLVLDRLPAAIADVVRSLADPLFKAVTERLTDLVDPDATERVAVYFHVPDDDTTPEPDPIDEEPGDSTVTGTIPRSCPKVGTIGHGFNQYLGNLINDDAVGCFYAHPNGDEFTQLGVGLGPHRPGLDGSDSPDAKPVEIPGTDAAWVVGDGSECYITVNVVIGDRIMTVNNCGLSEEELISIAKRILGVG